MLASILKPVDETRIFEKMGLSLAAHDQLEIHVIGFPSSPMTTRPHNLYFHPISQAKFSRLSWRRIIAQWIVLFKILKIKPNCLIITTHELLIPAIFCKIFLQCRVIYDVQENYLRNILYTRAFPGWIRPILAAWVRTKEVLTVPLINHFILAEKEYAQELPFALPCTIIQNKLPWKLAEAYKRKEPRGNTKFLFTGTLAETSGVFDAIQIVGNFYRLDHSVSLTLIGNCSSSSTWNKLQQEVKEKKFIRFRGERYPVSHAEILREIQQADVGLIIYPKNPSTRGSIPTKLFEYLALQLPILIRHNEASHNLVTENLAGIVLPEEPDYPTLFVQLKSLKPKPPSDGIYWESDIASLKNLVF